MATVVYSKSSITADTRPRRPPRRSPRGLPSRARDRDARRAQRAAGHGGRRRRLRELVRRNAYDHLAGGAGVALADALLARGSRLADYAELFGIDVAAP